MSKTLHSSTTDRSLSESERRALVKDGLQRIQAILDSNGLAKSLDLYLAVEIWNILHNNAIQSVLKELKFPSPFMYQDGMKMFSLFPLATIKFNKNPPRVSFFPLGSRLASGMRYDPTPFRDWWKKEVIHQPMRPPGDPEKIDVIN